MNSVILHGRLVRDAELIMAKTSGTAIGKFTIAVKSMKKDAPSNFINCVSFGATAERIAETLTKGSPIIVQGYLQTGSYTNKADVKVYTTDVIVTNFDYEDKQKGSPEITPTDDDSPF